MKSIFDTDVFNKVIDDSYFFLNRIKRLSYLVSKKDVDYYDELIQNLSDLHYNLIYVGSRNVDFTFTTPIISNDNQKIIFAERIYNKFKHFDLNIALNDISKHKEQINNLKPILLPINPNKKLYTITAPLIITLKEKVTKDILQRSSKIYQRLMSYLYNGRNTFLIMKRDHVVADSMTTSVFNNVNQLCETISKRVDPILPIHKISTNFNQMYCVLIAKESDFAFYSMLEPYVGNFKIYITME